MGSISIEFWIQIVIYAISFGVLYGQLQAKIKYIEKQLEKHNNFIERLYRLEESTRQAHSRIDDLREDLR